MSWPVGMEYVRSRLFRIFGWLVSISMYKALDSPGPNPPTSTGIPLTIGQSCDRPLLIHRWTHRWAVDLRR